MRIGFRVLITGLLNTESLYMKDIIGLLSLAEEPTGGGEVVLDRKYVVDLMHNRSRRTIDPPFSTMPGRIMSGFHRPGRHFLHQARNAVRCLASRIKGELHLTKNRC